MKNLHVISVLAMLTFGLTLDWVYTSTARAKVPAGSKGQDAQKIKSIQYVGLVSDGSQTPILISALRSASHRDIRFAAMHSLAQLGASESLPEFDPYIQKSIFQSDIDVELSNYAKAARARLIAESKAANVANADERALVKMQTFLNETSITTEQFNSAPLSIKSGSQNSFNIYALRELADMIYTKRDINLASRVQAQGISFGFNENLPFTSLQASVNAQNNGSLDNVDTPAALKSGLAPLSDYDRVAWLIDKLSKTWTTDDDTYYAIQLAVDQGTSASDAAATKLRIMDANRTQYSDTGFNALFDVIAGVGDKKQISLISRFVTDNDPKISHYAKIAQQRLVSDTPITYRAGY